MAIILRIMQKNTFISRFFGLTIILSVLTTFEINSQNTLYIKLKENAQWTEPNTPIPCSLWYRYYPEIDHIRLQFPVITIQSAFRSKHSVLNRIYAISGPDSILMRANEAYSKQSSVEYVEFAPHWQFNSVLSTNDPQFPEQWNLSKIQAESAWDLIPYQSGAEKVKIAIIDAAFLLNHEDFSGSYHVNLNEISGNNIDDDQNGFIDDIQGWDFGENDADVNPPVGGDPTFAHGTFVAGFAGAVTDNQIGIASVSDNTAVIIPLKIGAGTSSIFVPQGSVLQAIDYAMIQNADIISMSLSVMDENGFGYMGVETLHDLISAANSQGIIIVAASGNGALSYNDEISFPARFAEVIAVGSTDSYDNKASSSQYSSQIDIMAPGHEVLGAISYAPWYENYWSGTSFATPTVAGAIAWLKYHFTEYSDAQILTCLYQGADDITALNPQYSGKLGAGRLNLFRSAQCMTALNVNDIRAENDLKIFPNPAVSGQSIQIKNGVGSIEILSLDGRLLQSIPDHGSGTESELRFDLKPGAYLIKDRIGSKILFIH